MLDPAGLVDEGSLQPSDFFAGFYSSFFSSNDLIFFPML
ncbi:unnamed protein product [Tenebrio molitor]|nr:unnamed protein product [Tenebrio molitor]